MSLRHWETTRDAIRELLDGHPMTAGASPEEKDQLARVLTNAAIEAYKNSVYKDFKPDPEGVWDTDAAAFPGDFR